MSESREELIARMLAHRVAEQAEAEQGASAEPGDLFILSAKEAERMVERASRGSRLVRAIAEHVADPANGVCGDGNDFFNLVGEFRGACDYRSALMVARRGLELHPRNVDLLSAAISSAGACGEFDECEALLAEAGKMDFALWNDKLFTAAVLYLEGRIGSLDDAPARALAYAEEYQRRFPFDDVAYNRHATVLIATGRVDEAARELRGAIFGTCGPDANSQAPIVAPQCCLTYIDEVLSGKASRDSYREIIRVARKGIEYTAQDRPRANIAYFMYRDAEAQDALLCSAEDPKDGFGNEARVREALSTYRCAYELMGEGRTAYRGTIEERHLIVSTRSGITDVPLKG